MKNRIQLDNFNLLADFLLKRTKIDVRCNLESRNRNIVYARFAFIAMAVLIMKETNSASSAFLKKNHATGINALKKWNYHVHKIFLDEFVEFKVIYEEKGKYNTINSCVTSSDYFKYKLDLLNNHNSNLESKVKNLEASLKIKDRELFNLKNKKQPIKKQPSQYKEFDFKSVNYSTKNNAIEELLSLDNETINLVCETRIKPYLMMLKSKVTNEQLIQKQRETRTM